MAHLPHLPIPLIIGGGLALLALVWTVGYAGDRHGYGAVTFRWFTGHTWHGEHQTDAAWLRRGTRAYTKSGRAHRWHYMPRATRAGIRTGVTLAALATAYGLIVARPVTLDALGGIGLALGGLGAWAAWSALLNWQHHRAWVRPLHITLGYALALPRDARPASWLAVPRGYHKRDGAEIRVRLPEHFSPAKDVKRTVEEIVAEKLALENPRAEWHLAGSQPFVRFVAQLAPPKRVDYAAVRELIAEARETAPLLGLGRSSAPVYADLDNDSPHVLVSAGSGGGKSTITRTMVAQVLARGGVALILDIKRLSHAWARGLPNVRYCRDIADIHEALLDMRELVDQRNQLADEGADIDGNTDHVDVGPRLIILAEELNATSARLNGYWKSIKDKDDPGVSPAIEALGDVTFMGRQIKANLFAVAQMLTARTVGGPEARENMGVRILARYTVNAWRILVPEIWPPPRASRHTGRVQVCIAGQARETQVAYLTPAEARSLASTGTGVFPQLGQPAAGTAASPAEGATVTALHAVGELVGLSAAVRRRIVPEPITLDVIRKARQRDPEFPASRGEVGGELLYDAGELATWARNRPRSAAS